MPLVCKGLEIKDKHIIFILFITAHLLSYVNGGTLDGYITSVHTWEIKLDTV